MDRRALQATGVAESRTRLSDFNWVYGIAVGKLCLFLKKFLTLDFYLRTTVLETVLYTYVAQAGGTLPL